MTPADDRPAPRYQLWRQDENGNEFLVARFDCRADAERELARLASGEKVSGFKSDSFSPLALGFARRIGCRATHFNPVFPEFAMAAQVQRWQCTQK
jgi:hypothetical protein